MKKIEKKKMIFILIIIFSIGIYIIFMKENKNYADNDFIVSMDNKDKLDSNINYLNNTEEVNENKIVVYITGAVNNAGVYEIKENSRVADIIDVAGGLTENAFIDNLNLAYMLEDGMKIHIPTKEESISKIEDNANNNINIITDNYITNNDTNKTNNSKININTANQTELEELPGIGSSTALKIIEYRNKNGKFKTIYDIKNVSGIGDSKFEKIKNLIKV